MTRILAIDCATEACSVALFEGPELIAHDHQILGRGHAERLIPTIAALPDKGRAERILVSRGPGSFTGVRIGIAAARALSLAWKAELLGYPTLALVARIGLDQSKMCPPLDNPWDILVCMNGGHGEWFVQPFDVAGAPLADHESMKPEDAVASFNPSRVAGNKALEFAQLTNCEEALDIVPNAQTALSISGALLTSDVSPIYGRAPDAKPPK